jgi:hypothetical protein
MPLNMIGWYLRHHADCDKPVQYEGKKQQHIFAKNYKSVFYKLNKKRVKLLQFILQTAYTCRSYFKFFKLYIDILL